MGQIICLAGGCRNDEYVPWYFVNLCEILELFFINIKTGCITVKILDLWRVNNFSKYFMFIFSNLWFVEIKYYIEIGDFVEKTSGFDFFWIITFVRCFRIKRLPPFRNLITICFSVNNLQNCLSWKKFFYVFWGLLYQKYSSVLRSLRSII